MRAQLTSGPVLPQTTRRAPSRLRTGRGASQGYGACAARRRGQARRAGKPLAGRCAPRRSGCGHTKASWHRVFGCETWERAPLRRLVGRIGNDPAAMPPEPMGCETSSCFRCQRFGNDHAMGYDFSIGSRMYAPRTALPSQTHGHRLDPSTDDTRTTIPRRRGSGRLQLVQRAAWAAEIGGSTRAQWTSSRCRPRRRRRGESTRENRLFSRWSREKLRPHLQCVPFGIHWFPMTTATTKLAQRRPDGDRAEPVHAREWKPSDAERGWVVDAGPLVGRQSKISTAAMDCTCAASTSSRTGYGHLRGRSMVTWVCGMTATSRSARTASPPRAAVRLLRPWDGRGDLTMTTANASIHELVSILAARATLARRRAPRPPRPLADAAPRNRPRAGAGS